MHFCLITILISALANAQQSSPTTSPTTSPTLNASANTPPAVTPATKTPPFPVAGASALGGRVFNIEPGVAFNSLAPFLLPGDEVRLLPGVHIPFTLVDLRGERGKPIVIRGYQTETDKPLPYVKGETFSIYLLRPQHVIVRDLLVGNSSGPTVFIDGSVGATPVLEETPFDADLNIINLQIKQTFEAPNQTSIYLRSMQSVDVSNISIKGWNNSALVLDNCKRVGISQSVFDCAKNLPQYRGVAIRSGCEDISCMYVSFGINVKVAFEVGVCDNTAAAAENNSPTRPAQRILISHNAALECACFVSLGSVDNSTIVNNSCIESTKYFYKADGLCGVPNFVTIENNLVTWIPGRLERISLVAQGVAPESIRLQKNLWWSEELPAAFEIVGKPFGVELATQVFDINPKVEMRGFIPVDLKARDFGWGQQISPTPAGAAKTPLQSQAPAPKPS